MPYKDLAKRRESGRTRQALYVARGGATYRAKQAERQRAYRTQNPEIAAAHSAVHDAVSRGILARQPCRECGAETSQAHHHRGYASQNRLDVVWLCIAHHEEAHHGAA